MNRGLYIPSNSSGAIPIYLIIQGVLKVAELLPWPILRDDLDCAYFMLFSKFPLKSVCGGMKFTFPLLLIVSVGFCVVGCSDAALV